MGGLGKKFLHKLPDMEFLRNLESPFVLWIQIDIYFLASTSYLSDHGIFKVLAVKPFPVIEPSVYPPCSTPYFAGYMLDEHNRIFKERVSKRDYDNSARRTLARDFSSPFPSAREEIENWTNCYHAEIEEKHRESLKALKKQYRGTTDTSKKYRHTHCYSCKSNLDSEPFKECCACGWIICSCGACGCGYTRDGIDA